MIQFSSPFYKFSIFPKIKWLIKIRFAVYSSQLFDFTLPYLISVCQVAETKRQAAILQSYLEQRGVALPEGYLSSKVVLPNPKFRYALEYSVCCGYYDFHIAYFSTLKGMTSIFFFWLLVGWCASTSIHQHMFINLLQPVVCTIALFTI